MPAIATALILCAGVLAQSPPGAEDLARLAADFDRTERAAPDRRAFARRALDLAREAGDDAVAADALVWAARHSGGTPEKEEAIAALSARFLRSGRIAGACWPIAASGDPGEALLERFVAENPDPNVRGQACLGLAYVRRMTLREVVRYQATGPEGRAEWAQRFGQARADRLSKADPAALLAGAEGALGRVLAEFPAAVLHPEASDFFPLLSQFLAREAEAILARAAEGHPDPKTRQEAACALLVHRMTLATLVADAAGREPGTPPGRDFEEIPGGAARVAAIDPRRLAREIDAGLRAVADDPDVAPGPGTADLARSGLNLHHLLTDLGAKSAYHAGAERLLRRMAEAGPGESIRSLARRSLATHLAGLAGAVRQLRYAAGPDLARWAARLGEERVGQVRGLDPDALDREARDLAGRVAAEGRPDRAIEAILRDPGEAAVGRAAPEIEGEDLDGTRFRLGDHRGKVVLLDFWSHRGCAACREAYPELREVAARFAGRPFKLLGVNADDDRAELARLVAAGEVTWRFWLKHGAGGRPTFERWGIGGVPAVILLDRRGVIRARFEGTPGRETLETAINALLAESEGPG